MTGITKKRATGFYRDYKKYVRITVGFRKNLAQSCWDSIWILKKAFLDHSGITEIKLQDSTWITKQMIMITVGF